MRIVTNEWIVTSKEELKDIVIKENKALAEKLAEAVEFQNKYGFTFEYVIIVKRDCGHYEALQTPHSADISWMSKGNCSSCVCGR